MRRFWWVNHSGTAAAEIAGRHLWSPRAGPRGERNAFYDNMRRAGPGDLVLSYARRRIGHLGRVADFAFAAPRPPAFGRRLASQAQGWWLPVAWTPLDPPVSPRAIIGELGPLLPGRYSPISPVTGGGWQNAYLAEIGEAAFDLVLRGVAFDGAGLERAGGGGELAFPRAAGDLDAALEAEIAADPGLSTTEKQALITARRGQGVFREAVRVLEPACRVTGVANPWLLIASHIKPWRACASAAERLDGANGLMLTPNVDLLFDRGFLGFEADGRALVSPRLAADDLARLGLAGLGLEGLAARPARPFSPRQADYLAWHRRWVFVG